MTNLGGNITGGLWNVKLRQWSGDGENQGLPELASGHSLVSENEGWQMCVTNIDLISGWIYSWSEQTGENTFPTRRLRRVHNH
jgi:hypothetical protein